MIDAQPKISFRGQPVERFVLPGRLSIGRGSENDLVLADSGVSRAHAVIERTPGGFQVTDLRSRGGSLANGRRFEVHRLVIGDHLAMGPFTFRFDGVGLEYTQRLRGVEIVARHVTKTAGTAFILQGVSLRIDRGQFAAILGPSGSGKSSLLDTMTGLRPAQRGEILFDGVDLYHHYDQLRSLFGYVPQDDIVHTELTVAQALRFSARLRLQARTPPSEIDALVAQTIGQLGLGARTNTTIARLSGGQRKRVSVGVELLGGPAVLFLDEPTSGLDPASEFKMMALLRDLARGGCTVICTTHVMENVYLTDRLFVLAEGRLVFTGNTAEAREHFAIRELTQLYNRLEEHPTAEWLQRFSPETGGEDLPAPPRPRFKPQPRKSNFGTLLSRQRAVLAADPKNYLFLFAQPLFIGLLVGLVVAEPRVDLLPPTSLALFFAYLATLWFGTSNAAQEIVKELAIYRRERMVGLGRHTYLLSKFAFFGALTAVQSLLLYGCLRLVVHLSGAAWKGSMGWQLAALLCVALAAIGLGFAISAFCRTTTQAVMVVPLVLIPQILFSGFVVPAHQMTNAIWYPTQLAPSYAAQTLMDESIFWRQTVVAQDFTGEESGPGSQETASITTYSEAYNNLELQLNPSSKLPEGNFRRGTAKIIQLRNDDGSPFVYRFLWPGVFAAGKLIGWMLLGYGAAWFGVRKKERG